LGLVAALGRANVEVGAALAAAARAPAVQVAALVPGAEEEDLS
jgi:hypothetical protein